MRIIVDADACPVLEIISQVARENSIDLIIISNTSHQIVNNYGELIKVDKDFKAADLKVFNISKDGDIIVTADYGLAAMLLGKEVNVIDHNGRIFNKHNIEGLLAIRHHFAKLRRAGLRHPHQSSRQKEDDLIFKRELEKLIKN